MRLILKSSWNFQPAAWGLALGVLGLLSGCAAPMKRVPPQEAFSSTSTYSRMFDASPVKTCEAARRALLSQGYVIITANDDSVRGQKSFQPEPESHLQMDIRVVCAPESKDRQITLGFVTALQDRYALKKSNTSASLGVGALGSVSLPFSSSEDSLVKVGSETITSATFYDSFFALVHRYLVADGPLDEAP
ncbi:MAG: DUF2242 domain-containing protein [Rhodoferax sp.]